MPTKTGENKSAWSAKDIYDMIFSTYGNAHVNANKARAKEASKYMIPYIPEKEIMLTTGIYNTGKISTNLLDSIYNASQRTGVPLDIALGLAGRESTLGIGRGFKKGKSVSGTDLYSNWQQIQTIPNNKAQIKRWNSLLGRTDLTDEDYDFKSEFLMRAQDSLENTKTLDENPIDNALKFYQTGKYNPGDSRHTQMVEEDAKILMSDPAIQKWLKTKENNQMKCGGRRKAQLGLDIREGGIAIPIAPNMYYMDGRSHNNGGIAIGPNNKNGLEVEGGEVVKVGNNDIKVFSSVPLLRGVSPAQLVMRGANPNAVFKAQEEFKDRNRINDDGTTYEVGGEKNININNLPSSFRGRKIGNNYYQIGIPPSTNKIKSGVTGFKNYLKGLNDDLDEFGVTFTQVSKKVMPKPLRDTYAKIVNAIYKTNKIDKINTAANQIGTVSMATDKKKFGGNMIYEINGNVKNVLISARPKAQYGTIKRHGKIWKWDEEYGAYVPVKYSKEKESINANKQTKSSISSNKKPNYTINGTFDNSRPKYYAEKRLPIAGSQSIAEKAGLARSGWSYADNPTFDYVPNINISIPKTKTSSTPRGEGASVSTGVKSTTKTEPVRTSKVKDINTPLKEKKESLYITGIKNNSITPLRVGMEKIKSPSSTGGETQTKEAPWIPQYNLMNTRDWIGVGTNLAGHIASYFINNSLLNKAPMPIKPVQFQSAKLKTTHNINPELANINEVTQMNLAEVGRNTASSNTSIARKQRIMNEARDARNKLYGQKENIETQLINLDRRNRQDVYNRNIAAHNDWLNKTYIAKSNSLLEKQRNLNNLISGIPMAVNTILGTIENRKSTNDMIQAMAASRPNVDGRLLGIGDYYSQKLPDGRTAIYNKNHKLVKYV